LNLRSQIHAAIDEVAPPVPALALNAMAYALSEGKTLEARPSSRRHLLAPSARRFGSLVAAVLVIVLMVVLVVGGRVLKDRDLIQRPYQIDQAQLAKLRARTLQLPLVQAGAECPSGPYTSLPQTAGGAPGAYGVGPVFAEGSGQRVVTSWGTYFLTTYWTKPPFSGLALIRALDLVTHEPVVFAKGSASGKEPATPTGDVVGTDVVYDQTIDQHSELAIDASHLGSNASYPNLWPAWAALAGFANGSSGCIGFQVDTAHATEVYVVSYPMP
jgi:hypothetical protein